MYTVQEGDTLVKIAADYESSVAQIMQDNYISSSRSLSSGVVIAVCKPAQGERPRRWRPGTPGTPGTGWPELS
jgi:LysM repeat protein